MRVATVTVMAVPVMVTKAMIMAATVAAHRVAVMALSLAAHLEAMEDTVSNTEPLVLNFVKIYYSAIGGRVLGCLLHYFRSLALLAIFG